MAAMPLNLLKSRKNASRVADEEFAGVVAPRSPSRWNHAASFLCAVILSPFSLFSCVSRPEINGADGVWASAEMPQTSSEITHLMVRDSLRYAMLM